MLNAGSGLLLFCCAHGRRHPGTSIWSWPPRGDCCTSSTDDQLQLHLGHAFKLCTNTQHHQQPPPASKPRQKALDSHLRRHQLHRTPPPSPHRHGSMPTRVLPAPGQSIICLFGSAQGFLFALSPSLRFSVEMSRHLSRQNPAPVTDTTAKLAPLHPDVFFSLLIFSPAVARSKRSVNHCSCWINPYPRDPQRHQVLAQGAFRGLHLGHISWMDCRMILAKPFHSRHFSRPGGLHDHGWDLTK